ncbi:M16 family metallopeptidase [Aureimonas frigidaquae]|uniref:M16 family metallopeptidase n=1 Tax=Aureimonas frigidaquae TaxID=424757 RepID=UPI0007802A42|nr:pitrilysin family protein [Aureimonas frigidaquae]
MTVASRLPAIAMAAFLVPAWLPPAAALAQTTASVETDAAAQKAEALRPDIESFTLDNGLQVVVIPDHRAPVVTQMVWYKIGSADEPRGVSGIAHFLEHLMFKGTKTHPAGDFSAAVSDIGGEENAFTSYDYTAFFQQVPVSALGQMMAFEADRMTNLVLDDAAVLPERDVILEERRMRVDNDPGAQLAEAMGATLFVNSPYGTPIIGWEEEMEQLSRQDAIAFYDQYYTPNNATLIVAGDVTLDQVRTLAEDTFGKVARRAEPGERNRPREPKALTERTVTLRDARVTQPSVQTAYVVPSERLAEGHQSEALDILADVLGGGSTSRLYRALVVENPIAAGVGAYYQGDSLMEGQFITYGTPRGDATVEQVEAAIDAQLAAIVKDGITEDELAAAKNRVRNALIYQRDSQTSLARRYGVALSTGRTIEDVEAWPERIEAVTVDDVRQVARDYLDGTGRVIGYLLPAGDDPATASGTGAGEAAPAMPAKTDVEG